MAEVRIYCKILSSDGYPHSDSFMLFAFATIIPLQADDNLEAVARVLGRWMAYSRHADCPAGGAKRSCRSKTRPDGYGNGLNHFLVT
jgi:hypothetical protein